MKYQFKHRSPAGTGESVERSRGSQSSVGAGDRSIDYRACPFLVAETSTCRGTPDVLPPYWAGRGVTVFPTTTCPVLSSGTWVLCISVPKQTEDEVYEALRTCHLQCRQHGYGPANTRQRGGFAGSPWTGMEPAKMWPWTWTWTRTLTSNPNTWDPGLGLTDSAGL